MKRFLLVFVSLSLLASSLFAQIDRKKILEKVKDTETEITGKLTLRFYNALDGNPIKGGQVTIDRIGEYETDFEGRVNFPIPEEDGYYKVTFEHPKFITSEFEIEIAARTIVFNRFSISPHLPIGSLRVVIDWGKTPEDLDAHFVKEGENGYHISYRNMKEAADGEARLDRDDTDSFGPETITVSRIDNNSVYKFYVHDFTNRNKPNATGLMKSNVTVKVFGNNRLMEVFRIEQTLIGTKWDVFKIVDGKITF